MEWNAYTIWTIEYIFKWSIIDLNLFFYCSKFISKECWWSCNLNLKFAFWCIVYFLLCIIFILELCWILTILGFWNVNCLHCWNTTSKIPFLLCKGTLLRKFCFFLIDQWECRLSLWSVIIGICFWKQLLRVMNYFCSCTLFHESCFAIWSYSLNKSIVFLIILLYWFTTFLDLWCSCYIFLLLSNLWCLLNILFILKFTKSEIYLLLIVLYGLFRWRMNNFEIFVIVCQVL